MKIVELFQKIIKFFFTGCPNEKNINIPEQNPRLNLIMQSIYIRAYDGAGFTPIAVPDI